MSNKTVRDVFKAMPHSLQYRIELAAGVMLDEEIDPYGVYILVKSITKDVFDDDDRFMIASHIILEEYIDRFKRKHRIKEETE